MPQWIALLRGINVGGKNILPMSKLVRDLESLKLQGIRTYIQSGNVVLNYDGSDAKALAKKISRRIEAEHGFCPHVLLLRREVFQEAIDNDPFQNVDSDHKSRHYFFLDQPPSKPDFAALAKAKSITESYELIDSVFYLRAPDGIGRSKLAATAEKYLGVIATVRNFRTVQSIAAMAETR